jgi:hypothetical protein
MCLEYYPECGDGGDGCCERSLKIALAYVRRAFGNRKSIPSRSVVPPIHVRRVDFQLYAVWCDKSAGMVSNNHLGMWESKRTLAHCAPCTADWKIASANSAQKL